MIEKLDESKLREYKFSADNIERIMTLNNYELFFVGDHGIFWVSNIEKTIHSGRDGCRKYYFRKNQIAFPEKDLDLIPEYFELKEKAYLEQQKKIAGKLYKKETAQKNFLQAEINEADKAIHQLLTTPQHPLTAISQKDKMNRWQIYKNWLTESEDKKVDFDYLLNEFEFAETPFYNHFKGQQEKDGHIKMNVGQDSIKIYSPELALLLTSNKIGVTNRTTKQETTVNGFNYLDSFITGYQNGRAYFEKEFKVEANTLYSNADRYVRDLHYNFFHSKIGLLPLGWYHVKGKYPLFMTHKGIKELGYYSGIVSKVQDLISKYPEAFKDFEKCDTDESDISKPKSPGRQSEQLVKESAKPSFSADVIPQFYDLIKDFFSEPDQVQLKKILETGANAPNPLVFSDNGNRLADAFKQLINADLITGCEKKELETWICSNFNYRHRQQIKGFRNRYLSDIISTTKDSCQRPILNVTKDKATGKYTISKT
jgi:hypothetical protein